MDIQSTSKMGISAMNAASQNIAATANNVANLQSENYQARRLEQTELETGGTRNNQMRLSQQEPTPPGGSNVELEREMTNLIVDQNAYEANAAMVRATNQMMGAVLDLRA